ncbi:MAG TPA: hypothetical protein VFQ53_43375 [Kofleriaceae bacterium]|nr:hypothetical protein [Kofleriaceae bacterium]
MKRPPPALRIAILVAAVACLGLAMCARSKPAPTNPPASQVQQAPTPETQPSNEEQNGGSGTEMKREEGKMGKQPRESFPATKAPGMMY